MMKLALLLLGLILVYVTADKSWQKSIQKNIVSGKLATLPTVISKELVNANRKTGEFPWQVIIKEDEYDDLLCGGSIISSQWILTAAHCCEGQSSLLLRFGTIELENDDDLSITVTEMHIHPQYDPETYNNDVCLIKLPSALQFSSTVVPISLLPMSQANNTFLNSIAVIAGFGIMNDEYMDPSQNLLWARIKIIPNEECADVYKDGLIIDSTICGKGYDVANMSICNGDSGGAMITRDQNGNWMQIGINSFVPLDQCTYSLPSAYARISSFLSYIYNVTGLPQV